MRLLDVFAFALETVQKVLKTRKTSRKQAGNAGGGYYFLKKRYDKMGAIREDTSTESVLKKEKAPSFHAKRAR